MSEAQRFVVAAGSNIAPEQNLPAALRELEKSVRVCALSNVYETEPVGAPGTPRFWNAAVLIESELPAAALKHEVLRPIEAALGRVRTDDPNAPRPIDLDLVLAGSGRIEDGENGVRLPDPEIVTRAHIALPAAEVVPRWIHTDVGRTIADLAGELEGAGEAVALPEWQIEEEASGRVDRAQVERRLGEVRRRTLELVSTLSEESLTRQHIPILSPMVWDLGHIANFEEIWLVRQLADAAPVDPRFEEMFDAVANPRATRESLPLPVGDELFGYLEEIRARALATVGREKPDVDRRLLRDGFVYELVAQHEEQHQETLLQAMQVLADEPYTPRRRREPSDPPRVAPEMVRIPGGEFLMGTSEPGFTYDNERPRHPVEVDDFELDRYPVTMGEYARFVEDGGYERPELWSVSGARWLEESAARFPANWIAGESSWQVRFMDRIVPLPESTPVVHVCYYEADAYARWVGKRLPSEQEWEKAALWDPELQVARRYPWGDRAPQPFHANLGQLLFQPQAAGSYPEGASAYGVEQLIGDVWEWTSSDFQAYPGFEAYPYDEYSAVFFDGDYKVLRGGSWATRPAVARGTFRNWDVPIRRQIFAGFRCARDLG